jgi:hypothetical protein
MARDISNSADILDSRDIIARIDDLESERESLVEAFDEAKLSENPAAIEETEDALATWDIENGDELKALQALQSDAEGCADWRHGETLIRDSYFETYARDLAEDIGAVPDSGAWPGSYIDWEAAAEALQADYTSVDFDGVTYWIRS